MKSLKLLTLSALLAATTQSPAASIGITSAMPFISTICADWDGCNKRAEFQALKEDIARYLVTGEKTAELSELIELYKGINDEIKIMEEIQIVGIILLELPKVEAALEATEK